MSTVNFIRGIPAAGKTTLAKALMQMQWRRHGQRPIYLVSKDEIRRSVCHGQPYGSCDLYLVEEIRNSILRAVLAQGYDVVMDETFIEVEDINRAMAHIGNQHRAVLYDLSMVPPTLCVQRDKARLHMVGLSAITDAYRRLKDNDARMDELTRPFDEVIVGRMETWPSIILS
jgi:predicted kinase